MYVNNNRGMCKSVTARIVCSAEGTTHTHGREKGGWPLVRGCRWFLMAGLADGIGYTYVVDESG